MNTITVILGGMRPLGCASHAGRNPMQAVVERGTTPIYRATVVARPLRPLTTITAAVLP
jgi:hypothetical protein